MQEYSRPESHQVLREAVGEHQKDELEKPKFPFPQRPLTPEEQVALHDLDQGLNEYSSKEAYRGVKHGVLRDAIRDKHLVFFKEKSLSPEAASRILSLIERYSYTKVLYFENSLFLKKLLESAAQYEQALEMIPEILDTDTEYFYRHHEAIERDQILPTLAKQFIYRTQIGDRETLRSIQWSDPHYDMAMLGGILSRCEKKLRGDIVRDMLCVGNRRLIEQVLDNYPALLSADQENALKPRLDWLTANEPIPDSWDEIEFQIDFSARQQAFENLFVSEGVLELEYDELREFFDLARRYKQKVGSKELAKVGLDEETAAEVIASLFEQKRTSNVGEAIQFAWYYDGDNLLNIPKALDTAGLERGKRIPEEMFEYIVSRVSNNLDVEVAPLLARKTHQLTPQEYIAIADAHPETKDADKVDHEKLAQYLLEYDHPNQTWNEYHQQSEWKQPFQSTVQFFGAETTLKYGNRVDLNRHDAYYFMEPFLGVLENNKPELAPDESADTYSEQTNKWMRTKGKKIMLEVAKDDSTYDQGTAHHRFATVVGALAQADLGADIARMKEYPNVTKLQELGEAFESGKVSPFESWKMLKKWHDLHELLGKTELLDQLNSAETSPKMRAFVEKLAFHPNIAMDRVMQFWQQPAEFLDINDEHSYETNAVKKPANYLSLPYLGLDGKDLRDAYVEGEIDELQVIPPMAREYSLTEQGEDVLDPTFLHRHVRSAIGQARKGIEGKSRDPKKLFARVQAFCKANGVAFQEFFDEDKGAALVGALPTEQRRTLYDLIFDKAMGMGAPKTDTYRIEIGKKSDPDMVVAGNDTASCMPFGSGKNNVYMFNPNCAQLVVQRLTGVDEWRTAAQSVMTVDLQTSRSTPEMIVAYRGQTHLKDLLSEADLARPPVLTADNIEIAKNDEGKRTAAIEKMYTKFFQEYLRQEGDRLGVDLSRVVIGTGYTPAEFSFKREKNTYIPLAPMGYSDNIHEECLVLETGLPKSVRSPRKGVEPLRTTDSVPVAVLEGKAYHDNQAVIMNLHNMQNRIIGMEIANQHFDRPNLSFMYRDDKGVPRGYILAYEGVIDGKKEIFIDDLASDVSAPGMMSKLAGGRLIEAFFGAYTTAYGTPERSYVPLYMNARDQTSYQIIKHQIDKLAEKAGLVAQVDEMNTYESGGDLFHNVRIFIDRTHDDVNTQRLNYAKQSETQRYGIDESYGEESEDDRW